MRNAARRIAALRSAASFDYPLLFVTLALVLLGSFMVFSASVIMADSRFDDPYRFVMKQAPWVLIGFSAMAVMACTDYRLLRRGPPWLLPALAAVLLVLVLVVGVERGGARRWLALGPLGFQPSEMAKVAIVIYLASYLDRRKSQLVSFRKGLLPPLVVLGALCVLIGLEPDLGTPFLMTTVALCMLWAGGARVRHMALLAVPAALLVVEEILRKPYRLRRVRDFLASWGDIGSESYQVNQSIMALGNGGFFGQGLGQGQMKLNYLPEPHTDFIFPVIGEELGFLGTVLLIGLFAFLVWRGFLIARGSRDLFGKLLALGLTWMIGFQALLNMGVATGVFPTKGMPLPFISFGGTSLVITMACVGILLNISRERA